MNLFKWKPGRQGTGYDKMLLATFPFPVPFDLYLLRYRKGAYIDWHKDPVENKRHFRANLFIKQSCNGGHFEVKGKVLINLSRLQVFRPDIIEHRVTEVTGSTRYVLSLGWLW